MTVTDSRQCFDKPGLLILCSSLYGGGAERVACRLASALADQYRVAFIYIRDKGQAYPLDPRVQRIKIPWYNLSAFESLMDKRAAFVRQVKEELDIKVTISFMFTMNKLNVKSGYSRMICCERNNPAKRDPEHMPEINDIYERADHVVFQTETVRNLFSPLVRSHSSIILNPVSVPCLREGESHRIVTLGRLTPQKNQAMLLKAFGAFHKGHPEYYLDIYGEGELEEELKQLSHFLGLEDWVRFHGQVVHVHEAIRDAEVFALSSDYEGLSNALLECMMMGFACISTRCEGSTDVILSGKNGLLVDIGSEQQMAEAMTLLAEDPAYRHSLGRKAKESSAAFQTEPILSQWDALIRRELDALICQELDWKAKEFI